MHLDEPPLARQIRTGDMPLVWAKSAFYADTPQKIDASNEPYVSPPIQRLTQLAQATRHEFLLISPYFVPHDASINALGAMVARIGDPTFN